VIAPGVVAGLAPFWLTGWKIHPPLLGASAFRYVGAALTCVGGIGLLDSFVRFAVQGLGTPAPVFPTERLIVTGLYRHVRNPMYVAVVAMILGQALLVGSPTLLVYSAAIWLAFHLFVVAYEEPALTRRFGPDYAVYRAGVPRWIPRLSPWRPSGD
jgi:protein-S-isoprenylcysteine O-methyltransferase Ste14